MLINIIKNNLFIQNLIGSMVSNIPPIVEHNLAKYQAIKKGLYQTALEHTKGNYLEFGVFTGSSFNFAMKINKRLKYLGDMNTEFIGFDSFQGFGKIISDDEHSFFKDEIFSMNKDKVLKNIYRSSKGQKYRIIEGFFEETIKNKTTQDLNIDKARLILFDEYTCFKGNVNKGEYATFRNFKETLVNISFRWIFDYGYSGRAFIAYNKI